MSESLRILILEDSPADAELVEFELEEAGIVFNTKVVMTEEGFIRELQEYLPDLILSDYDLPTYNGALALTEATSRCPGTPFILVTGAVSEDRAIEILTQGAKDYVLKSRLQQRLVPAVRRALAEAEEHKARKKAEEELRKAHKELDSLIKQRTAEINTILNTAPVAIWISHDPECKIITGNAYADEVIMKTARQSNISLSPSSDEPMVSYKMFQNGVELKPEERPAQIVTAKGKSFTEKEVELVFPDGRHVHMIVSAEPLFDTNGSVCGAVITGSDVSKLKYTEEALRQCEERQRLILQASSLGTFEVDLLTRETIWNEAEYKLFGLNPGSQINSGTFFRFVHPEDTGIVTKKWDEAKNTGKLDAEFRIIRADGQVRWLTAKGQFFFTDKAEGNDSGKKSKTPRFMGVNFDITELKQAKVALQESEKQVRRKLDAILSPEGDIGTLELSDIIDTEKIQKLMDEFYKLTHIGIGIIDLNGRVLVGTGWQDICTNFHRVNPEACRLCMESDLELTSNVPVGTFKKYRCKNNMWDMATPIMLGDRHVGNIFLGQFLFDDEVPDLNTFREQAGRFGFNEQEYIEALDRVPRWSRETVNTTMTFYAALAELIGNLSYSNIKLANTLEERKRAEEALEEQRRQLENANKELESFTYSVSHDLRAPLRAIDGFSRMLITNLEGKLDTDEKNQFNLIRENTVKMNSLIDDLLALSRVTRTEMTCSKVDMNALAESAWKAIVDAKPDTKATLSILNLPEASGNRNLLFQVFSNLLSNAAKFTRKRKKALIEVGAEIKGQENVYYVKDNGAGFNMKYYDKLFGVFQRLHPESEYEGTGVGLAIVQRIIHRHGGRVWADGKVGKGATFYFTLPRKNSRREVAG